MNTKLDMKGLLKGAGMYTFAIGLVLVSVGVMFMYLLPPYVLGILNNTGLFTNQTYVTAALAAVAQIQALGMGIIMIGLIFVLVGIIGGTKGGKGGF